MIQFTYQVDEAYMLRAADAQTRAMLGKRWITIALYLAAGVWMYSASDTALMEIGGTAIGISALALAILWGKTWWTLRRLSREALTRMTEKSVTFELDDAGFERRSELGVTPVKWDHVTRQKQVSDFHVVWVGKLIAAVIPLSEIPPEAAAMFARAR